MRREITSPIAMRLISRLPAMSCSRVGVPPAPCATGCSEAAAAVLRWDLLQFPQCSCIAALLALWWGLGVQDTHTTHTAQHGGIPQPAPDATGFPPESMHTQLVLLEALLLLAQPPESSRGGPPARTALQRRSLCTESTRTGQLMTTSGGVYTLV